jgi:hypothetical protein
VKPEGVGAETIRHGLLPIDPADPVDDLVDDLDDRLDPARAAQCNKKYV